MNVINFDESGNAVDPATGKVVGRREENGQLVMTPPGQNSQACPPKVTGIQVKPSYTKYEVTPESEFEVRFCLYFEEGRVRVFTEEAKVKYPECELHWVKFRMWTYREELDWRKQSQEYDGRAYRLNTDKFDELKLRHLIKSWSLEQYDPKFKLLHVGGVLSDESLDLVKGLYPSIVENILYLMNQVLEGNR